MDEKHDTRKQVLAARDAIPAGDRARRSIEASRALMSYFDSQGVGEAISQLRGESTSQPSCKSSSQLACEITTSHERSVLVAVYAAMKSEVGLAPFIAEAYARGWRVCFPVMIKGTAERTSAPAATPVAACTSASAATHTTTSTITDTPASVHNDAVKRARMEFFDVPAHLFERAGELFLSHPLHTYATSELEKEGFRHVEPAEIDACVAPVVAFDAHRWRLGYGGGNYDHFLGELRVDARVAGVAFAEQEVSCVPREPHDLPLPYIVVA